MSASYDIAVVGSGAAGIAAAVNAARRGCKTLLLDQNPEAGGTGGFSGLTTLCGLYDDGGEFLNDGFAREFAEAVAESAPLKMGRVWVLPYRPSRFRAIAQKILAALPTLETCWNAPLDSVKAAAGRIQSINGSAVSAVIDCTGTAEVARSVGAACLATDATTQAPAVIFTLQHVKRDLLTAADAAQVLLPLARAGFAPLNFHSNLDSEAITVKFTGPLDQVPALVEFLRTQVHGFENCTASEPYLAHRAGRMIMGDYLLTGADALAGRKFPDATVQCAWPIEQWDVAGTVKFRYLPPGTHYQIPAACLRSRDFPNLFMAGKTISADADAIASARVMGCCLATGAAAGNLAADSLNFSK